MSQWKIDTAHATAQFKVKHMGLAWVPGHVYGITGDIDFDPANISNAKFSANIDLTTLTTGMAQRDGHLKSADFFDVEKYPNMKFESTSVEKTSENHFIVKGNLTIKETTKEIEVNAEYLGETEKQNMDGTTSTVTSFILSAELDRRDFGLNWNIDLPGGKLLVGNEAHITIDVEAIKQ